MISDKEIRKTIRLIKQLRAKAASTTFPEEAESLLAKAAKLMAKINIWPDWSPPGTPAKDFILRQDRSAHERGRGGRMFSRGVTQHVKPVTVAPIRERFEPIFVTTPRGRPKIHASNAEKQRAYRRRKLLNSLEDMEETSTVDVN
ncbi:DUF2786 domain-containing protein [Methylocella sp.]|jgi:hypothetical protein|uniref:DUF2786 domain-containing protein n=1 Tax=Methylocella sp. TaxID=1978226 RepID=UPI003C18A7AD